MNKIICNSELRRYPTKILILDIIKARSLGIYTFYIVLIILPINYF